MWIGASIGKMTNLSVIENVMVALADVKPPL
jgi:hypothetical protein